MATNRQITQHIRFGFALALRTLLPLVAASYMLGTLGENGGPKESKKGNEKSTKKGNKKGERLGSPLTI